MGSVTTLAIGNLEVDWGKNYNHINHAPLFLAKHLTYVDHPYFDEDDPEKIVLEKHRAFVAPLEEILPRLELLGHTRENARENYYFPVKEGFIGNDEIVSFEKFLSALTKVHINHIPLSYADRDYDPGEFTQKEIIKKINLFPEEKPIREMTEEEYKKYMKRPNTTSMGYFLEYYDPWAILRLLAENPENLKIPVVWNIDEIIDGGYVKEEDVLSPIPEKYKFIIVTEGSSDTYILKKALYLLKPNVEDFFIFIDMEEGYPFTGVGNLHNFCKGLAKIGIINNILIIYDSDTEGFSKYLEGNMISLPQNMRMMKLPNLELFKNYQTIGPSGHKRENINNKAVAIECFLDLQCKSDEEPRIRWTSYNQKIDSYQGELLNKNLYTKQFLSLKNKDVNYDFSKLEILLDSIISECIIIASKPGFTKKFE